MGKRVVATLIVVGIILLCFILFMPSIFSGLPFLSSDQVSSIEAITGASSENNESEVDIEWQ